MGSRRLCLGGHGDSAAAGYRVGHGAQGSWGLASPSSSTAARPGVLPPSSSTAVHPGDSTGKRGWVGQLGPKVPRGGTQCPPQWLCPSPTRPRGASAHRPGHTAVPCTPRPCTSPILPCLGQIPPFECHWCPQGVPAPGRGQLGRGAKSAGAGWARSSLPLAGVPLLNLGWSCLLCFLLSRHLPLSASQALDQSLVPALPKHIFPVPAREPARDRGSRGSRGEP